MKALPSYLKKTAPVPNGRDGISRVAVLHQRLLVPLAPLLPEGKALACSTSKRLRLAVEVRASPNERRSPRLARAATEATRSGAVRRAIVWSVKRAVLKGKLQCRHGTGHSTLSESLADWPLALVAPMTSIRRGPWRALLLFSCTVAVAALCSGRSLHGGKHGDDHVTSPIQKRPPYWDRCVPLGQSYSKTPTSRPEETFRSTLAASFTSLVSKRKKTSQLHQ